MRIALGDQDIAVGDDGVHFGIAFMDLGVVKAMDPAVAIAGLAAAFFLKCNPWLDPRRNRAKRVRQIMDLSRLP